MCEEKSNSKARLKVDINKLPDAPKPSTVEHTEIEGGVRSMATIVASKYMNIKQRRKNEQRKYGQDRNNQS